MYKILIGLLCLLWMQSAHCFEGMVIKVYDGDTATIVSTDQIIHKVRLAKIDAPELKQFYGKQARTCLATKILNKKVKVVVTTIDRYQRDVGEIFVNERSVNAKLVKEGCAWVYRTYNKDSNFVDYENSAKEQKLGIWSTENPMPPWQWRREKKNSRLQQ